jgi:hypothetical protein
MKLQHALNEAKTPKFKDQNVSDYVEEAATSGPEFEDWYYDEYEVDFSELSDNQKKSVVKAYLTDSNGWAKFWRDLNGKSVNISGGDLTKAIVFVAKEIGNRVA